MHVAGVAVGGVFQYIFTPFWLKLITVVSFFIMGVVCIYMGITEEEEEETYEEKLREIEMEMVTPRSRKFSKELNDEERLIGQEGASEDTTGNGSNSNAILTVLKAIAANESIKIILTILCTEMGDRSQISAVALAANYEFWIVAVAGSFGHILALILAILFGRAVSEHTTEKCINIVGGLLFLTFCAYSIMVYYILDSEEV